MTSLPQPSEAVIAAIRATRCRLNTALFLDSAGRWVMRWMQAAGIVILLCKVLGLHEIITQGLWLLTVVPLLLILSLLVRRNAFDDRHAATWLDSHLCGGGTILATLAYPDRHWPGTPPEETFAHASPNLTLARTLKSWRWPGLFLVAVLLVPGLEQDRQISPAAIRRKSARVRHRIDEARRLGALDEEKALEMTEMALKLAEEAKSAPEAAAEGVDSLQDRLDREILANAEAQRKAMEAAQKLAENSTGGSPPDSNEMNKALEEAMSALPKGGELPEELQRALDEAMKKMGAQNGTNMPGKTPGDLSKLDSEAIKKLAEALKKMNAQSLQNISKAGKLMSSAEMQKMLGKMGEGAKLSEMGQIMGSGKPGTGKEERPGRGGISRGRGDADLSFGNESDESAARFKTLGLKPGETFIPGVTLSKKKVSPKTLPPEEFRAGSGANTALPDSGRGDMMGGRLSPYHEKVVSEYFQEMSEDNHNKEK